MGHRVEFNALSFLSFTQPGEPGATQVMDEISACGHSTKGEILSWLSGLEQLKFQNHIGAFDEL